MTFERVLARDVRRGDRITRSRKQTPLSVIKTQRNLESVWLTLRDDGNPERSSLLESASGYRIRPGLDVKFWKEIS